MTKYEKFEEWMVGKEVEVFGFKGVVLDRYYPSVVVEEEECLKFQTGNGLTDWMWAKVSEVEFLEESSKEEETSSAIDWEVGQVVWDVVYGEGRVTHLHSAGSFPVAVDFGHAKRLYTLQGVIESYPWQKVQRTLFFSEPVITAELFPPKKPFEAKLKEGDKVLIKDKKGLFGEGTVRVVYKECDDRIYVSEDGNYFLKHDIASIQVLGEEVKFD